MNRLSRITFCLLLAGCATLTPKRTSGPFGVVRLTPQWRTSTGSNARTVEVFVENGTDAPLALSNLALRGMTLPALLDGWTARRDSCVGEDGSLTAAFSRACTAAESVECAERRP